MPNLLLAAKAVLRTAKQFSKLEIDNFALLDHLNGRDSKSRI